LQAATAGATGSLQAATTGTAGRNSAGADPAGTIATVVAKRDTTGTASAAAAKIGGCQIDPHLRVRGKIDWSIGRPRRRILTGHVGPDQRVRYDEVDHNRAVDGCITASRCRGIKAHPIGWPAVDGGVQILADVQFDRAIGMTAAGLAGERGIHGKAALPDGQVTSVVGRALRVALTCDLRVVRAGEAASKKK
jgi:hypothetical protein